MKTETMVSAAILTMLSVGATQAVASSTAQEKCYGIAKAKMNDCGVKDKHQCAGVAAKDGMPGEWIFVPKGTCKKIVGGSMTPSADLPSPSKKIPAPV